MIKSEPFTFIGVHGCTFRYVVLFHLFTSDSGIGLANMADGVVTKAVLTLI